MRRAPSSPSWLAALVLATALAVALLAAPATADCPLCVHGACPDGNPGTCNCYTGYTGSNCDACATDYEAGTAVGRDLPVNIETAANMTVEKCIQLCASYNFAGLQAGDECWCGTTLGKYGRAPWSGRCDQPCAGNATQICGGVNYNSIYVAGNVQTIQLRGCYYDLLNGTTLCYGTQPTSDPGVSTPSPVIDSSYAQKVLTIVFSIISAIFGLTCLAVLIVWLRGRSAKKPAGSAHPSHPNGQRHSRAGQGQQRQHA